MRPLFYLFWRRTINSLKRAIRTPRLLLPALLALLVLASQIAGLMLAGARGTAGSAPAFTRTDLLMGGPAALIVAIRGILLLSLFTSFLTALGEGNLFFAQSDVDFLFPAPLKRRNVLLFKMLSRYMGLLIPAIYMPLALGNMALSGASSVSPLGLWPGMLGSWLYLTAVTNIAQVLLLRRGEAESVEEDEERTRRRNIVRKVLTGIIIALLAGAGFLILQWRSGSGVLLVARFLHLVNSDSVTRAILPDAWASDLFRVAFAGWQLLDFARLAGLVLLSFASFAWLFARDRDFYESALEMSAKRERLTTAMRGGDAGAILSQMAQEGKLGRGRSLRPFGGGARAIFWKDLIAATRTPPRSYLQLFFLASFPAVFGAMVGRHGDLNVVFWVTMFAMQMSSFFLLSLRDMLRRADISKALPISPARLLFSELGLSIIQLTVLGWFSLGLMMAIGMGRGPLVLTAVLVMPSLSALMLFVQTSFVLLYPNPNDPAQQMVSNLLSLLAAIFSLIPAFVVGIVLFEMGISGVLLALAVSAVNLIGATLALAISAILWQRFDPTD